MGIVPGMRSENTLAALAGNRTESISVSGKSLAAKKDRTPAEDDMLDMMLHGGERVKAENLSAVLSWYHTQN